MTCERTVDDRNRALILRLAEKERTVQTLEKRIREIQTDVSGMVFTLKRHADGRLSLAEAGDASTALFCLLPSELCDAWSRFFSFLVDEDRGAFIDSLETSAKHMSPWRTACRHRVRDALRWYEYRGRPTRDDNGDVVWRGVVLDITDTKKREADLDDFRFAMDYAGDAVFWMVEDGGFTYVNEQACRSLGYTLEELTGKMRLWDIDPYFPKERHDEVWEAFKHDQVESYHVETFHKKKDGTLFPVEVLAKHLTTGGKRVHVAFVRDITDRKQVERLLHLTQFAVDHASIACYWISKGGQLIYVNNQACASLGYSREELLTKTVPDIDPEFPPKIWSNFWSALIEKEVLSFESVHQRKDGTEFPVAITANYVKFKESEYSCAFVTDISERQLAEANRIQLESQLHQAQKMEAIGSLAGGIAHDFNNILVPIMTCTELVMEALPNGSKERENLKHVLSAATRAKDLVRQILVFSRQGNSETKPLRIVDAVKEVIRLVRSSLPSTINIVCDLPEHIGQIMADPTQIHQITMNLVTNAYHAMEETDGTLTISVSEIQVTENDLIGLGLREGNYACLTVVDTGVGMSNEVRARIFEPYFTTKDQDKGTGLGLSVVHGIVKALDGEIVVESEPLQGTQFHVYLPMMVSEADSVFVKTSTAVLTGSERILMVDDEPDIVSSLSQMLTGLGYRVTGGTDSLFALETFKKSPDAFDLLITDMTMPRLTGHDLTALVRKARPDIPVLLLTGFKNKLVMDRAASAGVDRVLTKPLRRESLAKAVRSVLAGK